MKQFFTYALLTIAISVSAVGWYFYNDNKELTFSSECNLKGKVIRVTDGDSITILDNKQAEHKVRMAGIDAPERKQPYGNAARQYLAKLVFKKQVCIGWYKRDKYQRLVGIARIGDEDINLKMIEAGLSWHYRQYQNEQSKADRTRYADAQKEAKKTRKGLWRNSNQVPPWLWRRGER